MWATILSQSAVLCEKPNRIVSFSSSDPLNVEGIIFILKEMCSFFLPYFLGVYPKDR